MHPSFSAGNQAAHTDYFCLSLGSWKIKSPGTSLTGLTYLDVPYLMRLEVELIGMDKKAGMGWPKGDGLTGFGSKHSWGKVSRGDSSVKSDHISALLKTLQ